MLVVKHMLPNIPVKARPAAAGARRERRTPYLQR